MTISRYSSKRSYNEAVFDRLHAQSHCKQNPDIAFWVDNVSVGEADESCSPHTAKRPRVLRDVCSNSERLNTIPHEMDIPQTRQTARGRSPPKKDVVVATRKKSRQKAANDMCVDVDAESHTQQNTPSFPPPASSLRSLSPPKKRTASTKADLAYLNPNIEFYSLRNSEELGITLPKSVIDLWDRCEKRRPDPLVNHPPIPLTDHDHRIIDDTLSDAFEQGERWRDTTTEPHWISVVVGPTLHLLRRVEGFRGAGAKIAVLDVTPTEISPAELIPFSKDPSLYRDLDKRIDYVVGLDLPRTTLKTLRRTKYCTSAPSINQTATFANETPIFLNVEVKRRHVARDPTVQLAAWIAAEFTKRRYEGWDLGFPVFAIEIDGDNWLLRVVAARVQGEGQDLEEGFMSRPEDEYELFFLGPLALGNTFTLEGSKRLLANLLDIARWGQSEFRLWWEANVQVALEERLAH